MYYNFEKLKVWQESRLFIKEIFKILAEFPNFEFSLKDQIKRAALSIALNIAEGSDKRSKADFIRYLRISLGSINEVVTGLYIANDIGYINNDNFKMLYEHCHKLSAMINALVRTINAKK